MTERSTQQLHLGFEYPTYPVQVTRAFQSEKLRCCNVDPAVFGDRADISGFAMETIMAAKRAGISINGSVHVSQKFELLEPVFLEETMTLSGRVTVVEPEPRGHMVTSTFELTRSDGTVPLRMERVSLRMDASSGRKGPRDGKRSELLSNEGMTHFASRQLEPEKVARYSIEAENLIHSEPEIARQFGFRAPIAGGLMAVRLMMEALWTSGPVDELGLSVRFRRPMFWDEKLEIYTAGESERVTDSSPMTIRVLRQDGKIANEALVRHLVRPS